MCDPSRRTPIGRTKGAAGKGILIRIIHVADVHVGSRGDRGKTYPSGRTALCFEVARSVQVTQSPPNGSGSLPGPATGSGSDAMGTSMLRELRTFVAVARHGSFAAAGQVVGLTPSAVNAQIHNLEAELGVRLFDRTGSTAILHMNGKKALGHAEEVLATFARMIEVGDGVALRGELKVGAIATVRTGLLPEAMVTLQKRAPALRIHIVSGVSLTLLN